MLGGKLKTIIHNPYHYYIINTPHYHLRPLSKLLLLGAKLLTGRIAQGELRWSS